MSSGKVLVALSSSSKITLQNGKNVKTGFFLIELIEPIKKLREANYDIVYANPLGNEPALDHLSDSSVWWGFKQSSYHKAKKLLELEYGRGLKDPRPFRSISNEELEEFQGIFIPGGHAPMDDLGNDPELGRILKHFHEAKKPTAVICHGSIALLSTEKVYPEGQWPYHGYKMTCYSNKEERLNQLMWFSSLKIKVEDALRSAGAKIDNGLPMQPNCVLDRELISAQGPTSVWKLGNEFVKALRSQPIAQSE